MPSTTAAPSNLLVLPNTRMDIVDDPSKVPPNRFIMFGDEWLVIQSYVQQGLLLPINQGDWNTKYGSFSDQKLVTDTLEAMKRVHNLSAVFGNPSELKKKISTDPNYMFTAEPPSEIYAHIVWLAIQIQNAASTYNYTLANLRPLLDFGTKEEKAANLKMILIGPGGLVSTAEDMKTKTNALLKKLTEFDGNINAANEQLQKYSGQSSQILANANQLIGKLSDDINRLNVQADVAYQKWRDYTIAACVTGVVVGIFGNILFPGLALLAGAGVAIGLGIAAANERATYNALRSEIAKQEADKQKKSVLVTDLKGFDTNIGLIAPALVKFKQNLDIIQGVWLDIGGNLSYIATNYGVDELSNYAWIQQAMKIGDATAKWQAIATTTQQFTQNSLISYSIKKWGDPLPAAA
ncbi:alpha-xenorhabdolysin family binary toxin subunit A [Anabaena azotica]|uniref:Alpha-xenorhabdolysin family binary toxin subunit A n=1 Tax=Anabaena azotica FACHB-119 TaxID=947527 RepID=A0ABR8DEH8_9NOST|nr:alpha-xenorhabdolysin family binary toxin subunit A [Anabaena azotica]MBD2505592.1 alpha-xenorhabdolysin family binary toxin subunit A [Anabaena azotica FACHB-119]